MNHLRKKSALAKYKPMAEAGIPIADIEADLRSSEYNDEEVSIILNALIEGDNPPASGVKPPAESETETPSAKQGPPLYDEYKVEISYKFDKKGEPIRDEPIIEKLKKIKTVQISHDRAERMNAHTLTRKIKYFPAK